MMINFPAGPVVLNDCSGRIGRALVAWKLAGDGREVYRPLRRGVFFHCVLTGHGETIVGESRLGQADADANAIAQAGARTFAEIYGADNDILVEIQRIAI